MDLNKETAIGAVKGGSAVAEAEDMHAQIVAYIDGEAEAVEALTEPVAFFKTGSDFIGGDLDMPVLDVFEGQPDYVNAIPGQWAAGKAALMAYSERSGKPIPDAIVGWMSNAEAGWEVAKQAASVQSKVEKVVELYRLVKPFALMAL